MPLWLFFSLVAAIAFAVGQVLSKKGLTHISPLWSNIFGNAIDFLIWVPTMLILSKFSFVVPSFSMLFILFVSGACYMLFYYAISKGDISLTGTLSSIYPVSTIILSFIFLGERINILQISGIVILLFGILILAIPTSKLKKEAMSHKTWIIWGLVQACINGSGDFLAKVAVSRIGIFSQVIFLACTIQIASVINFLLDKKGRTLPKVSIKKFFPTLCGAVCSSTGFLFFFFALNFGKASLVAPVTAIFPAITVVLAILFLHERITRRQFLSILGIIIAVVLLGV